LHPSTVRVLRGYGIDLAGREPQHLNALEGRSFDFVITLCDRIREECPEFPGPAQQLHWSIPDPAAAGPVGQDSYPAFERMAAELHTRIGFLLAALSAAPGRTSIQET
jgi:protein-tyrosine-phosphatase